jgi:hypothetical protein
MGKQQPVAGKQLRPIYLAAVQNQQGSTWLEAGSSVEKSLVASEKQRSGKTGLRLLAVSKLDTSMLLGNVKGYF